TPGRPPNTTGRPGSSPRPSSASARTVATTAPPWKLRRGSRASRATSAWPTSKVAGGAPARAAREAGSHHRAALEAAQGLARLAVYFGVADIDVAERAAVRGRELAELLGDRERLPALPSPPGLFPRITHGPRP